MAKLHVGQGSTIGPLTFFPVWSDRAAGVRDYVTARTGGANSLRVSELPDGPSVSRLLVSNGGDRPVLVLDGQLFEGGWQHRMATRSHLVSAGAERAVEVACVEQGRWHGSSVQSTRGRRVSPYVRAGYDVGAQSEVWSRVERYAGASATRSFVDGTGRAPAAAERGVDHGADRGADRGAAGAAYDVEALVRRAVRRARPLDGQVGVVVGVGGQPLTLELFDHPDTLREQFAEIVRAAGLDALAMSGPAAVATPGRRARRLIERLERVERVVTTIDPALPDEAGCVTARGSSATLELVALRRDGHDLHLRATYRRHPLLIGA